MAVMRYFDIDRLLVVVIVRRRARILPSYVRDLLQFDQFEGAGSAARKGDGRDVVRFVIGFDLRGG